ncbi:cadherin-like and PC-esterase domain-containing protein 1 [Pyxicephalus adspersus]|uniref:cadherin-like and PC-esterase domain-containing protein 1 n=1 Tax=Pyxicephalus adspersus TaxID=30357 RepID=UPI003B5BB8E9
MGWRRRYCPRPIFVAVIVAVCLFYQCLSLLWKSISWTSKEYAVVSDKDIRDVAAEMEDCSYRWDSIVKKIKDYEEIIKEKLVSNAHRKVLLYTPSALNTEESSFYKRILTRLGYTVLQFGDIGSVNAFAKHKQHTQSQDILIYIPSNKEPVNIMPGIQQILCEKNKICEMALMIPELENLSICTIQSGQSQVWNKFLNYFLPNLGKRTQDIKAWDINALLETFLNVPFHHHKPSPSSPLVRVFVLITSLSPLRAYIHSTAMVQDQPQKTFSTIKLQHFYEHFFKPLSPVEAFKALKVMISRLLLTLELINEAAVVGPNLLNRCNECFQLLTFDIGYSHASPPSVLKVKELTDFRDLNLKERDAVEIILEDLFKFILQNNTSSFLEVLKHIKMYQAKKENICWINKILDFTMEDMDDLYIFMQELTKMEAFEMIYPSSSLLIKKFKNDLHLKIKHLKECESSLRKHEIFSSLMEYSEIFNISIATQREPLGYRGFPRLSATSIETGSFSDTSKVVNCSNDNDTLSYISRIFSNPPLDLTPEFNPKIKDYYVELPFDVVTMEIGAEPAHCKSQVHLDDRDGPRAGNYPLGLGFNQITLHVMDESKPSPVLLRTYRITVHREDRPSMPLFDHHRLCSFVQDCGLIIHEKEPCGLQYISKEVLSGLSQAWQRKCDSGDAKGQWIVPCLNCLDNRTCDWRAITWQPYKCYHPVLQRTELQQCVKDRKILFIGDSTNRGMMYYLTERVNGTLQEWQKTHGMKLFDNVNYGRTNISYSYYPQFWIDAKKRPTFEDALEHLLERSHPLENTNRTVLVVGGVQWLNSDHLKIIHSVLEKKNLSAILVIIKSIGMGFHLPVRGIRSLSPVQVRQLSEENTLILKTAAHYGYEVVDTFSITMGRYKEFLSGKCGCHYHEVVKNKKENKMKLIKSYSLGGKNFPLVPDIPSNLKSLYHVQGPVNQVYSEILLSRICT